MPGFLCPLSFEVLGGQALILAELRPGAPDFAVFLFGSREGLEPEMRSLREFWQQQLGRGTAEAASKGGVILLLSALCCSLLCAAFCCSLLLSAALLQSLLKRVRCRLSAQLARAARPARGSPDTEGIPAFSAIRTSGPP